MPSVRELNYLWDILNSAESIQSYVLGVTEEGFYANPLLQDAVIRRFEIIGEAAARISDETRALIPELPWRQIVGMRHRLIHEYDNVHSDVIWESTQTDMAPLIKAITPWVQSEERLGENS